MIFQNQSQYFKVGGKQVYLQSVCSWILHLFSWIETILSL